MSLSDTHSDQFEPIAVNSLEIFDKEYSNRTEETKPDFDRFKALFEKPQFGREEENEFKMLYENDSEAKKIIFKPLIDAGEEPAGDGRSERSETISKTQESPEDLQNSETPVDNDPEKLEKTPEEKGYNKGFEKGFEKGEEKGFKEGFKTGEQKGFTKGEQKGIEQGRKKGIIEGEAEGKAKAQEEAVEILSALEKSLKTADQTLDLLVDKYETGILSLIEQIVKKIIMAKIEIDDGIVKPMIIDALKTLVRAEEVVLSVSQNDYEYIKMIKDEFFEAVDSLTTVSVRSDSSIKKGGCKIETSTASISSDVESRLKTIFEAVKTAGVK